MKRSTAPVLLALVAMVLFTGCVFDSDDQSEEKKGKIRGKVSLIFTGDPVADVKLMLVNTAVTPDTVNYANNAAAFVDSAFTSASGEYLFEGVAPGSYGIVPVYSGTDTTKAYRFNLAQDSEPAEFSLNGETRRVDFTAENMYPAGVMYDDFFSIQVVITNCGYMEMAVILYRRQWSLFIPTWENGRIIYLYENKDGNPQVTFSEAYGYTCLLYTIDNYFRLSLNNNIQFVEVGFSLLNTPKYSKFEYNYGTKTLTRIE